MQFLKKPLPRDTEAESAVATGILKQTQIKCPSCKIFIERCDHTRCVVHCPFCGEIVEIKLAINDRMESWQQRSAGLRTIYGLATFVASINMAGAVVGGVIWFRSGFGPFPHVFIHVVVILILVASSVGILTVACGPRWFQLASVALRRRIGIGIVIWLGIEAVVGFWLFSMGMI